MRHLAALAACAALGAQATTTTTDFSDLWYNSSESGWGVNIIQQNDIQFITMFVYGANGQPTWFVGPDTRYTGQDSNGILGFSGPLYATTGPYFGAATFNPNNVIPRQVGSIAFAAGEVSGGVVSYSVDGVTVTKTVRRQTWRAENLSGVYIGATVGTYSGCGAARNGYIESPMTLTIGHDGGPTVTLREQGSNYTCNYSGTYSQEGRMGRIVGNGTCSDGTAQSFSASEVQLNIPAVSMRFGANFTGLGSCQFVGRMGGVRRVQ